MKLTLPGTVLPFQTKENGDYFGIIAPIFSTLSGVTLSQVRELTGLTTATIQNWVKRGYIPAPQSKRYEEKHLLRILLINSIKGAVMIEDVQKIMVYINGDVADTSDDIISDKALYNCLCRVIKLCENTVITDDKVINNAVTTVLSDHKELDKNARERLQKALYIMTTSFFAAQFREITINKLSNLKDA